MERYVMQKAFLMVVLLGSICTLLPGCGGVFGGGQWNTPPIMVTYSVAGVPGTINEPAKSIEVTVPYGTDPAALVATFTTTGTGVQVETVAQTSGSTVNNFTGPVVYTVTAASRPTATYTVHLLVALNSAKALTAYSFVGFAGNAGTVNEAAKTISVTMPYGSDVSALIATFTTTGEVVTVAGSAQTSGVGTVHNFNLPVLYMVTAANGTTATYTVNVTIAPNPAKAITAYSFVGFTGFSGIINEAASPKSIGVNLPFGTDVSALIATFTTTGRTVTAVGTTQSSGALPTNDFTSPVLYTVTAADGSKADYTVKVTISPNPAKAITAYSFVGFTGFSGTINEAASPKSISVNLPFGTDVSALIATFSTTGTTVKIGDAEQTSNATANNFLTPVIYRVIAADGSTAQYTVTVTIAPNPAKAITAYSFVGFTGFSGTINEAASPRSIGVNLPFGTDVTTLIARFTTTGTVVRIGSAVQTSTATLNSFTTPVIYTVSAADGSTASYTVTVTIGPNPAKAITAYSFVGFSGFSGTINEAASPKSIGVNLPFGTDVTSLIASFTTTGTMVKVGVAVQTSTATLNNFTSPVIYRVTAADGSTTDYTINVTIDPNPAKAITAYSFVGFTGYPGSIDEASSPKRIGVTLPYGTDVTNLIAAFTTTGTVVKVGSTVQTSSATLNNFSNPQLYTVTAADGSTTTYTVNVTIGPNPAKAITAYSFVGFSGYPGIINENGVTRSIVVNLPYGTNVTNLIATFTTTGTVVKIGSTVQTSTATLNDFTASQIYVVIGADGSSASYSVVVTIAPSPAKAITAYSFVGFPGFSGIISETSSPKGIAVNLPFGTDLTTLTAAFTTTGAGVKIGTAVQTSTATLNDFTTPVTYRVTAADGSTADYTVTVVTNVPNLGGSARFAGFGGNATLTSDGLGTVINGDIGVNAASTKITGLRDSGGNVYTVTTSNDGMVNGLIQTLTAPPGSVAGAAVKQGRADALVAFNSISPANLPGGIDVSSLAQCPSCGGAGGGADELAGRTLPPGVYKSTTGTFDIGGASRTTADLTLDARGNANAVWIFQAAAGTGTLNVGLTGPATPAVPIHVALVNGAQPRNVFWYVPAGAVIGTGSTMVGTILADASITLSTTGGTPPTAVITTLNGRALCLTAGVTMTNTVINVPAP
jgi:Ice-binding-like